MMKMNLLLKAVNNKNRIRKACMHTAAALVSITLLTGCMSNQPKGLVLSGTIEATEVDINTEVSGKITKLLKEEGSSIKAGELIAVVDQEAALLDIKSSEAALKSAKAKLDETKAGSRAEEIEQAQAAAESAKAKLDELTAGSRSELIAQDEASYKQAKEAVITAQKNYDYRLEMVKKLQVLLENEAISEQELKDAQNVADTAYQQLVDAKSKLEIAGEKLSLTKGGETDEAIRAARANYNQALSKLKLLKKGATAQAITAAEANAEQLQAALDLAKLKLNKYNVKASVSGVLLYKNAELGQFVSPGTVVGTLQTDDSYWIKVYLPQKYNSKIALNQKVRIGVSALEGEKIEGTVIFKSPKAEFTPKNIETTESKEENTVVAVKVRIDSHKDKLSPGMNASVYID